MADRMSSAFLLTVSSPVSPFPYCGGRVGSRWISKLRCSGFHILFAGPFGFLFCHTAHCSLAATVAHVFLSLPWGGERAAGGGEGAEAGEKGRSSPSVRASSVPEPPVAVLGLAVRFPSIVCLC